MMSPREIRAYGLHTCESMGWGDDPAGQSLAELYRDAEREGATIYWGTWSPGDLLAVIPTAEEAA